MKNPEDSLVFERGNGIVSAHGAVLSYFLGRLFGELLRFNRRGAYPMAGDRRSSALPPAPDVGRRRLARST